MFPSGFIHDYFGPKDEKEEQQMKKALTLGICVITALSMSVNSYAVDLMKSGSKGDTVRQVQ